MTNQENENRIRSRSVSCPSPYKHLAIPCLVWSGERTTDGYGRICNRGKKVRAHRLMWASVNGDIPTGLMVLHKCDNRLCVEPSHLFLGTFDDNMADMNSKCRRDFRGERNPRARLTASMVKAFREQHSNGKSVLKIVQDTGFPESTIHNAIKGNTWKTL